VGFAYIAAVVVYVFICFFLILVVLLQQGKGADIAGAFGGAALLAATGQPVVAMAIGVLVTGLVCYLLKQDDALRPAFVAVIIVTLIGENSKWHNSIDRVFAVIIGCVCALVVGFLFDKLSGVSKLLKKGGGEPDASE